MKYLRKIYHRIKELRRLHKLLKQSKKQAEVFYKAYEKTINDMKDRLPK